MEDQRSILSIIRGEIQDFIQNDIEVVEGEMHNQYQTIKRCHLYLNSTFEDKSLYQGQEKIFFNNTIPKRDVVAKFLNIDTKDIRILSKSGSSNPYKLVIAQKELDNYLKEGDVAQKINDAAMIAASFGSVVIKKTPKGDELVDMRRLFNDPTVSNLQKSRFVTFKHLYTISELKAKAGEWDDEVIERIVREKERSMEGSVSPNSYEDQKGNVNIIRSSPYIEVYERYGEVEEWRVDNKNSKNPSTKIVKALIIAADVLNTGKTEKGDVYEKGGVLFKSVWKKPYPVDEYHIMQIPGRWLGISPVELNFASQERLNELANQKRISMELSTLHLFQAPTNTTIVDNVLDDLQNGQVLITNGVGRIEPIVNEERNLAAFAAEEQRYEQLSQSLTFVTPQAAGEAIPTSTPATNAVIQQNNVVSVHNFKRQNFANFWRRYLRTFVLPKLLTQISQKHILNFMGDYEDMAKLQVALAVTAANEESKKKMLIEGKYVSLEEQQASIIKNLETARGKKEIQFLVKEAWFDDVELDFDILIDNEQQATDVLANNTWQVIQSLIAAPQALQNPITRALIMDYAEKVGINPIKLESMDMGGVMGQSARLPDVKAQQAPVGQGAGQMAQMA